MTALLKGPSRSSTQSARLRRALEAFEGTGVTHDGSIPAGSSLVLPEPSELSVSTFGGSPSIIRIVRGEEIMVAGPAEENLGAADGAEWLAAYRDAHRGQRSEMLNVDDPIRWSREEVEAASRPVGIVSKVRLEAADANGVQVGGSEDVKRVKWNGHGGFALARWCGADGWTGVEAVGVFEALGIPLGKSAIIGGVYAGKKGTRGDPAPMTESQANHLRSIRAKLAGASASHVAAIAQPEALKKTIKEAPLAAPTTGGKGSRKKAREAKVMAEVTKRRKAGK